VSDSPGNDDQPVTVIVPASVVPSTGKGAPPTRSRHATVRALTIALLCVTLLLLLGVVVVLPDLVAERSVGEAPAAKPAPAPAPEPPSQDARQLARDKRAAENILGGVLRKQTELEAEGVATWGGADYDTALDRLAAGDAELQAERYAEAAASYEKVGVQLDALAASKPDRLASALAAGEDALAANDGPAARRQFAIALALDAQDERARAGMLRARVLEQVLAFIEAGAARETQGDLDAALKQYAAALALDARSPPAMAARDAVTAKIRQREFTAAMSAALAALESGDFAVSRAALTRAEGIRPGTPEAADLGKRLQLAVQASRIESQRNEARALEAEERWAQAAEHYAAALAVDPNAAFARSGRERSLEKARIHAELDAFLAAPGRLSAAGPREHAHQLLAAAAGFDAGSEPKLAEKVARLATALKVAETPMPVTLRSDNLTEVTVYKVGRFGRFTSRDLQLPPGDYVAVGQRVGYRDVRVEFTLIGGEEAAPVTIRCREKI
jgi:tetratricopeptide (TPR) repeat protein